MIRLIVGLDIEVDTVEEAYRKVYNLLGDVTNSESPYGDEAISWESSDEWYDNDGEPGDPAELQQARMKVFAEDPDDET